MSAQTLVPVRCVETKWREVQTLRYDQRPSVNTISQVTSGRGHGSRMNAQALVPIRGSETDSGANTSIRPKAEREHHIASDEQARPWESNERASPSADTWKRKGEWRKHFDTTKGRA